ncbi:MAG: M23 family metallopeptidase [Chloroflexota bacterium]
MKKSLIVMTVLISAISACGSGYDSIPTSELPTLIPSSTMPSQDVIEPVSPTATILPTALIEEALVTVTTAGIELSTAAPDPLHLVFPDAAPAPVSAWRPPLYTVPWAPTPYDHFYFTRPIAADEVNWPLANYRYGGVFFEDNVHTGVDIPAPPGTPVLAAGDGKVIWAGYGLYRGVFGDLSDPYGKVVVIQHDFGYQGQGLFTVYGHLQRIDVPRGQVLSTGDVIGLVGETGFVTGPHLHFEIRVGAFDFFSTLNPELWLVPPQGWGILAGRIMNQYDQPLFQKVIYIKNLETGQTWQAISYGFGAAKSDPYYQENMAVSDLPAGRYELKLSFFGRWHTLELDLFPGRVSYFTFHGIDGFSTLPPPTPGSDFDPRDPTQ